MKKYLCLLAPLILLSCNLSQVLPAASDQMIPQADNSDRFSGQRADEPLPTLLPDYDLDAPSGEDSQAEAIVDISLPAEAFLPDLSSKQLAPEFGASREKPYPVHTYLETPSWDFQVLEVKRGQSAWEHILGDDPKAVSPPDGYEYMLVKLFMRNKIPDDRSYSFGLNEIAVVSDAGVLRTDSLWGIPMIDFFHKDIYAAESMVGWMDVVIPMDESNPLLTIRLQYQVLDETAEGRLTHYIALEPGAAYSPPGDLSLAPPNNLGSEPTHPAPLGATIITADWELTILEVLRGPAALEILQEANQNNPEPPAGMEYIAARMRLFYRQSSGEPVTVTSQNTVSQSQAGQRYDAIMIFVRSEQRYNWLNALLYPGGTLEGWTAVGIGVGEQQPVLVFQPPAQPDVEFFLSLE